MISCTFYRLFTGTAKCYHQYQIKTEEETCTKAGREYRKCSLCGREELIRTMPALGHLWETDEDESIEPTCTSSGRRVYRCERDDCGEVYRKTVPATGHRYVLHVIKTATDKREGTYNMVCSNEDCEASTKKQTIFPYKTIKLSKSQYPYTGSAIIPSITIKDKLGKTIDPRFYDVVCYHNKKVGTETVHVTFSGMYSGKMTKTFKIVKGTQTITAKAQTFTVPKQDVDKAAYKFSLGAKGKTKLTYKSGSKKISVNKNGAVTVKKGTKKGTYSVTVTAKGTKNWKKATKKIKIKVK